MRCPPPESPLLAVPRDPTDVINNRLWDQDRGEIVLAKSTCEVNVLIRLKE